MPHFAKLLSQSATQGQGLWSSQAEGIASSLQQSAKNQISTDFRAKQEDLHEMYRGQHIDALKSLIRQVLPQEADRLIDGLGGLDALDLVAMITRDLSVVFHREPETDLFDGVTGEALPDDHPDRQLWKADKASVLLGPTLRQVDEYTTLHRTCPVQVAWVDDGVTEPHVQWVPHPVYRVHVNQTTANPLSAQAAYSVHIELPSAVHSATGAHPARMISFFRIDGDDGTEWHYSVHDEHGRSDAHGMTLNADPKDTTNPYGLHPVAVFRDGLPERGHFFLPWREAWWMRQRQVNLQLVDLVNICRHQGFSVLVAEHAENIPKDQLISPGARVDMLGDAKLSYITATPNIDALEKVLENGLRRMAIVESLPADHWTYLGGVRNLASMKQTRDRKKIRQKANIPHYDCAMRDLWRAHKAVTNEHRAQKYAASTMLRVSYPELPEVVDEFQHTQALGPRLALNLTSPVEEIARERSVSLADAAQIEALNKERNTSGDVQEPVTLNGAQLTAASAVVVLVATGEIPRASGVAQLVSLFNLDVDVAEAIVSSAGTASFASASIQTAAPLAAAAGSGVRRPSDVQD